MVFGINKNIETSSCFYFIIGLLSAFCVKIFGLITFGEVLLIVYTLWCLCTRRIQWNVSDVDSYVYWLIVLLFLCIFSTFITGLLNNSSLNDQLKNIGTIFLIVFSLLFFKKLLLENDKNMIPFLFGYGISPIIVNTYFYQYSDLVVGERGLDMMYYKEEMYAYIIGDLAFFVNACLYKKNLILLLIANAILGILCLFGMSRTFCLILVITDFLLICNYYITQKGITFTPSLIIKWGFLLCFILVSIYKGYAYLAENGLLGEDAKNKYEIQSSNKGGIFSARSYIVRGFITISHHPLGGIGLNNNVDDNENIRRTFSEITSSRFRFWDRNIMSHSAVFDWWIAYGILTFLFWLYIMKIIIKGMKATMNSSHPLTALTIFSTLLLIWNMFASPFSNRVQYGFSIMLLIYILHIQNNKTNEISENHS